MSEENKDAAQAAVNAAAVRLGTFTAEDADAWFLLAESQFGIRGVTSEETRFWHVVTSLDSATAGRLARHVGKADQSKKYSVAKAWLLKEFAIPRWKRAERVLAKTELGDQKPSQLVDWIRTMLDVEGPEMLATHIVWRCLPSDVQQALRTSKFDTMEELGVLADEVMKNPVHSGPVCNVSYADDSSVLADPEETMVNRVEQHQRRSNQQIKQQRKQHYNPPQNTDNWRQGSSDRICRFHRRFGDRARNCSPPCSYRSQAPVPTPQGGWSGNGSVPPRHQ
jgi:hypothetical protein